MMSFAAIQYLRGFEGKPITGGIKKGTYAYKVYQQGVFDRKNNLPNRYLK